MSEYLEFGQALAEQAGQLMVAGRNERLSVWQKGNELVTDIDHDINTLVIDAVLETFPGHAIIGEERSYGDPDAEHLWRLDPLDGTREYVEGEVDELLTCGFGLAKQQGDTLEMGLFLNPFRGELFTATAGGGAFLNGVRLAVNAERLRRGVAYDYHHWQDVQPDLRFLDELLGPPLDVHSAIYQGCMVAKGESAFSVYPGDRPHDITPAAVLVAEAGGRVVDLTGRPHNWRKDLRGAVFTNEVCLTEVVEMLDQAA